MESINKLASQCKIAHPYNVVYNSECIYTFYNVYHPKGILVNLENFLGSWEELANKTLTTNQGLFVRISKERHLKPTEEEESKTDSSKPRVLGVGVEGGFASPDDKYEIITTYSVVLLCNGEITAEESFSDTCKNQFAANIVMSVESVINHSGAAVQQDLKAWELDDEPLKESKYAADLPFVDNGVTISPDPSNWKCQKSGDTANVWLNLSTGYMGGGRRNWDGSGGSNGALDHFHETGQKYPLVVKLGTITADPTTADCYSYAPDENGPVKISNLNSLLERRGIKVASMQKTVKNTAELEVELNATYAFDAITESGSKLIPVSGPGLQGLQNLGNSCYINTVVQTLFSGNVPELSKRYGTIPGGSVTSHPLFQSISGREVPDDALVQTVKLAMALTSGAYAGPLIYDGEDLDPKYRLAPRMYKNAIARNHSEFSTGQQQDAAHFFQHVLEHLDNSELRLKDNDDFYKHSGPVPVSSKLFAFKTVSRTVCTADSMIKYRDGAPETILSLRIPMELIKTRNVDMDNPPEAKRPKSEEKQDHSESDEAKVAEDQEIDKPTIKFQHCLEAWHAPVVMDDYKWPHLNNTVVPATSQTGIANFPRYLMVQLQRYELGPDWAPKKLEVNIEMPEQMDLTSLKCTGEPQDGEILVPDKEVLHDVTMTDVSTLAVLTEQTNIDEQALSQLMDMGFSMNGCKRALSQVGGSDVEAAMNWIFEHNMDPDFNDPLPDLSGRDSAKSPSSGVDENIVQQLVESLGCFTSDQVKAALKATDGAMERAADWLFSNMDDLDSAIAALEKSNFQDSATSITGNQTSTSDNSTPLDDGPGKYTLLGCISHIGKNTGSGHYVCHLKKVISGETKWVIFNDEKVALSEHTPLEHAYLYLFQRDDTIGLPDARF